MQVINKVLSAFSLTSAEELTAAVKPKPDLSKALGEFPFPD